MIWDASDPSEISKQMIKVKKPFVINKILYQVDYLPFCMTDSIQNQKWKWSFGESQQNDHEDKNSLFIPNFFPKGLFLFCFKSYILVQNYENTS